MRDVDLGVDVSTGPSSSARPDKSETIFLHMLRVISEINESMLYYIIPILSY